MSQPFTDAQLAAFLAGTLEDDVLLDAIEAAINADPALADRVEALAAAGDDPAAGAVRNAFAPVLAAPVPESLTGIVRPAAPPAARLLPTPANDTGASWRWPQFAAMAASLVLGVVIGGPLLTGGGGDDSAGLVLASAEVETMLATLPSGQQTDLASLGTGEVVLTFRDGEGRLCRQFLIEQGGTTSDALACAAGSGKSWQIEAYGRRAAPTGEMKLAGGDAAPAVVAAVDAIIAGDPLIGADETAVLGAK